MCAVRLQVKELECSKIKFSRSLVKKKKKNVVYNFFFFRADDFVLPGVRKPVYRLKVLGQQPLPLERDEQYIFFLLLFYLFSYFISIYSFFDYQVCFILR